MTAASTDPAERAACQHDPRYSRSECAACGHQVSWCDRCGIDLCECNPFVNPPEPRARRADATADADSETHGATVMYREREGVE